jgi:tripartite-type tricarboxylate transporter receptor subunit TctC
MRLLQRRAFWALGLMTAMTFAAADVRAQGWPQHTVKFIVPLPAGTGTDLAARLFGERLATRWGQPVVVENRQGGDGIPAVTAFLSARDNHTFLFSFAGIVSINPVTHDKLPYDPARDVVPIASAADNFLGLAASVVLKVDTLDAFVKRARAEPGKLNWAATPGTPFYMFAALQKSAGIDIVQAPYRDFTPALQDLGEGRVHAVATGLSLLLSQVNAGRAKLLIVTNRERSPLAPNVPTAAEAGFPDLTFEGVVGLYGWRDMPADLKDRIAADVRAVGADPEIAKRLATIGSIVHTGTSADFAAAIEDQRTRVAAIAKTMTAKPAQ